MSAMSMFKIVATTQLQVVFILFLLGNPFRAVPVPASSTANACGWDLYRRVVLVQRFLGITSFTAFILLVTVMSEIRIAEAAAADHEGIGSVIARWRRRWLRGTLHVAVALSFAASILAIIAFKDGLLYRTGCGADHAGYGSGSPLGVVMMGLFALVHGFNASVAVTKN